MYPRARDFSKEGLINCAGIEPCAYVLFFRGTMRQLQEMKRAHIGILAA